MDDDDYDSDLFT